MLALMHMREELEEVYELLYEILEDTLVVRGIHYTTLLSLQGLIA